MITKSGNVIVSVHKSMQLSLCHKIRPGDCLEVKFTDDDPWHRSKSAQVWAANLESHK